MDDDDKDRWLHDPYTQRMLESAKKQRAVAIDNLVNACRSTTDVRVMEMYSKVALYDGMIAFIRGDK